MPATAPIRVWDLPLRLFHWALALCIVGSVVSAKIGGGAMVWHFRFGYVAFTLLLFRLLWGVFGGRWSRFASFVFSPATLWHYLRGPADARAALEVGHSPIGALSVFAMLGILVAQVATGLVADDEIISVGPLNRFVAGATALSATAWHKGYGQWIVLGLVALHLLALAVYTWRGQRLVRAMVTGDKLLPADVPASTDTPARRALALVLLAVSAGVVTWVVRLGGS